ncbi:flagellar protein FlaG [Kurthia gibsonii]|uniref:flagellar protein FlaG n=1 Tax=Kurthia gibsonii TaxID=33946 RepID=UPI002DB86F5E|nr:flagellar protein FlaG [Kurthia gibsonii]MEB6111990.1 flagellar protein FlaG [Kurthia gibsonii]
MKISSDTTLENTVYIKKNKESIVENTAQSPSSNSINISEMTDEHGQPTKEAFQVAINKLNSFMEYTNKSSKFVFHEGLGKYYVEVVDAKTEEVIKEIPPKELLDAYYEMQKMIGHIVDQSI